MKYAPTFKEHILRYGFAMPYAWKRDTLDVGGKEGFGTTILSMVATSVANADIEQKWLRTSDKNNYWCPYRSVQVDLNETFPEGAWDTMVAFEVIEHVDNPDFLVKNMTEHLSPGGRLVFSVPHMVANHEHKTLFDEAGIKKLIQAHLELQEFYIQDKTYLTEQSLYKGLKCYVGVAKKRED